MNTYELTIERFIVDNTIPDRPNYVSRILARCYAVSTVTGVGTVGIGGFDVKGEDPVTGDFVPFDQLTPEIAENWIKTVDDGSQWAQFVADLDQMINVQTLTTVTDEVSPPWEPAAAPAQYTPLDDAVSAMSTATTATTVGPMTTESVRALVYQVLEEINSGTV